jgi:hypothetical protein
MTTRAVVRGLCAGALLAAAVPAWAIDPWEAAGDNQPGFNSIGHGETQVHDLQETNGNDVDWIAVPTLSGHSYEARLSGATFAFDFGACPQCPQFERVNDTGGVLTEDLAVVNEGTARESYERTLRWIAGTSTTRQYVRVTGHLVMQESAAHIYKLRFWDTTYSVPRWSAANGQATVFQIANVGQPTASVMIEFMTPTGGELFAVVTSLPRNRTWVLDTSQYPQLAGASGYAQISHTAGYGGLAGKAVTVEPAAGIAYESPLIPIPY